MQVKLISKNKEKTEYYFLIKNTEHYILNAIRRSTVSLVPVMAVETVEFRKNTSLLYDEMLAHRIGLMPLKTDLKHYEIPKTPEDEESLKCHVKLSLKAKGPKTVYSKDLKSTDPAVVPVYEEMPIVKLTKNQELAFEATAVLGYGKQHMKWSPGIVFYKNKPVVEIKGNVNVEELKNKLPDDSAITIQGNKVTVNDEKLYTTNYLDAFVGESLVKGVNVSMVQDEFIFYVESFGQLTVKEMMAKSIDLLKEKFNEFNDQISKLK